MLFPHQSKSNISFALCTSIACTKQTDHGIQLPLQGRKRALQMFFSEEETGGRETETQLTRTCTREDATRYQISASYQLHILKHRGKLLEDFLVKFKTGSLPRGPKAGSVIKRRLKPLNHPAYLWIRKWCGFPFFC